MSDIITIGVKTNIVGIQMKSLPCKQHGEDGRDVQHEWRSRVETVWEDLVEDEAGLLVKPKERHQAAGSML